MKKCPVCAVDVEDNAPFCNICGVNLAGAKDVGPSEVETPVIKAKGKPASSSSEPKLTKSKPSFYLPAIQFLIAVALLGLVLYYTTGDVPTTKAESSASSQMNMTIDEKAARLLDTYTHTDQPLDCPPRINPDAAMDNGCPLVLENGGGDNSYNFDVNGFSVETHQFQTVLALIGLLGLCIIIQARRINDSNIMAPLIACILVMAIIYVYVGGGYSAANDEKADESNSKAFVSENYPQGALDAFYSTIGVTAALVVIIVSYIVFLYAVTGKDISEAPLSTIYSFVGAGSLVFAALHHNWV